MELEQIVRLLKYPEVSLDKYYEIHSHFNNNSSSI
jgi:hypothetical protein